MAEPTTVTDGKTSFDANTNPDYVVWTDEIVDPVNGVAVKKQYVALADGTDEGTQVAAVTAAFGLEVDLSRVQPATLAAAIQVTATGSAGTLIAANATRRGLSIRALSANTQSCFYGPATVSATTGMEIKPGEIHSFDPGEVPGNLIQCISASGSQTLIVQEST